MPLDNSSANWKIERAKELLDGLDVEVRTWIDSKPYGGYTYINPEKTRASFVVKVRNQPPIVRWSLIVADIIHNLRCALDHTFWAILQTQFPAGLPKGAEKLSFPIWDGAPNSDQRGNFTSVGPIVFSAVDVVQPYRNPFEGAIPVHPLAIIRDIDNSNKHKLLFTVMPSIGKVNVKVSGLRKQYQDRSFNGFHKGEIKDDIELTWADFDVPHPYMKYEIAELMFIIAIKHPVAGPLGQDRDDYATLIDILIAEVRRTIGVLILVAV